METKKLVTNKLSISLKEFGDYAYYIYDVHDNLYLKHGHDFFKVMDGDGDVLYLDAIMNKIKVKCRKKKQMFKDFLYKFYNSKTFIVVYYESLIGVRYNEIDKRINTVIEALKKVSKIYHKNLTNKLNK